MERATPWRTQDGVGGTGWLRCAGNGEVWRRDGWCISTPNNPRKVGQGPEGMRFKHFRTGVVSVGDHCQSAIQVGPRMGPGWAHKQKPARGRLLSA
jgi:hypothetical protein